jgi:hypothetical protein
MLIDKVCGISELGFNMKNENQNLELKKQMLKRKSKSSFEFQHVFENEIKKEKYNG